MSRCMSCGKESGYGELLHYPGCIVESKREPSPSGESPLARNTTQQQPAAEGEWVLFPREPTAEILLALSHALGIEPLGEDANEGYPITGQQSTVRQYYAALIAAAPAKVAVSQEVVDRAYAAYERTRWTGRPESPPPAKHYQAIRAAIEGVLNGDAGS